MLFEISPAFCKALADNMHWLGIDVDGKQHRLPNHGMPVPRPAKETVSLLSSDVVVSGAVEYGLGVATAYPGTPPSKIMETLAQVANELGIHVE